MYDNPVLASYNDGECPDCGEKIPMDVSEGDSCETCGHIFLEEHEDN